MCALIRTRSKVISRFASIFLDTKTSHMLVGGCTHKRFLTVNSSNQKPEKEMTRHDKNNQL